MIVSNTTPISNFLHLQRLDILQMLFSQIHIPPAVKQEIEAAFFNHGQWQKLLKDEFFVVQSIKDPLLTRQLLITLHPGEAEALSLCMENNARVCLLDDKDARAIAHLNTIAITGTLGILIAAKEKNIIDSVKYFMDTLKTDHHFWIGRAVYKKALILSNEID